ncbi:TPA: hypothetical protein ACVU4X_003297 [Vibrio parahaemolyticus]
MSVWALIFYVVMACVCCGVAEAKGRSGFGYLLLSLIITPIAVLVVLLCLGDTAERLYEKELIKEKAREEIKRWSI